jgi:ectoine hydroxylase-related dioxygenase (phytanoyl-CoA dioxygenase family)
MIISDCEKEKFENEGYIIVKDESLADLWCRVDSELSQLVEFVVGRKVDIFRHSQEEVTVDQQSRIYDQLHYLTSLAAASSNETILSYCKQLGLSIPVLMGCCNMRYDRPQNQKHLFKWHQDTVYLLGSLNAVTVWIPFSSVNSELGSIAVIPGSHKNGLRKFKITSDRATNSGLPFLQRDIELDEAVRTSDEKIISADRGDLVIFKQMLLHRSVQNMSNQVRWTAQLRISDLTCKTYKNNNFKNGDRHNVFQVSYPGYRHE